MYRDQSIKLMEEILHLLEARDPGLSPEERRSEREKGYIGKELLPGESKDEAKERLDKRAEREERLGGQVRSHRPAKSHIIKDELDDIDGMLRSQEVAAEEIFRQVEFHVASIKGGDVFSARAKALKEPVEGIAQNIKLARKAIRSRDPIAVLKWLMWSEEQMNRIRGAAKAGEKASFDSLFTKVKRDKAGNELKDKDGRVIKDYGVNELRKVPIKSSDKVHDKSFVKKGPDGKDRTWAEALRIHTYDDLLSKLKEDEVEASEKEASRNLPLLDQGTRGSLWAYGGGKSGGEYYISPRVRKAVEVYGIPREHMVILTGILEKVVKARNALRSKSIEREMRALRGGDSAAKMVDKYIPVWMMKRHVIKGLKGIFNATKMVSAKSGDAFDKWYAGIKKIYANDSAESTSLFKVHYDLQVETQSARKAINSAISQRDKLVKAIESLNLSFSRLRRGAAASKSMSKIQKKLAKYSRELDVLRATIERRERRATSLASNSAMAKRNYDAIRLKVKKLHSSILRKATEAHVINYPTLKAVHDLIGSNIEKFERDINDGMLTQDPKASIKHGVLVISEGDVSAKGSPWEGHDYLYEYGYDRSAAATDSSKAKAGEKKKTKHQRRIYLYALPVSQLEKLVRFIIEGLSSARRAPKEGAERDISYRTLLQSVTKMKTSDLGHGEAEKLLASDRNTKLSELAAGAASLSKALETGDVAKLKKHEQQMGGSIEDAGVAARIHDLEDAVRDAREDTKSEKSEESRWSLAAEIDATIKELRDAADSETRGQGGAIV